MTSIANEIQPAANQITVYNRVPKVTVDFWLIKLMAVTVGETAADFLAANLRLGLATTSWLMCAFLAGALALQFAQRKYVPWVYWTTVVLVSVVGTLISDNLVDNLGIGLETTTVAFAIVLSATFIAWYGIERTLSIHTIYTARRETFYWLAILFTFALGTSAGDLVAERMDLGYLEAGLMFGSVIAVIAAAYCGLRLNALVSFWLAYILTRPMGASFGDLLAQPTGDGGFGFGTVVTSSGFLACIAAIVAYMTLSKEGLEPGLFRRDNVETEPSPNQT